MGVFWVFINWTFAPSATPPYILLKSLCPSLGNCGAQAPGFLVLFRVFHGLSFLDMPLYKLLFSPGLCLDSLLIQLPYLGELIYCMISAITYRLITPGLHPKFRALCRVSYPFLICLLVLSTWVSFKYLQLSPSRSNLNYIHYILDQNLLVHLCSFPPVVVSTIHPVPGQKPRHHLYCSSLSHPISFWHLLQPLAHHGHWMDKRKSLLLLSEFNYSLALWSNTSDYTVLGKGIWFLTTSKLY